MRNTVLSIIFFLALSCIFWTWRIVHRHAVADQEQGKGSSETSIITLEGLLYLHHLIPSFI